MSAPKRPERVVCALALLVPAVGIFGVGLTGDEIAALDSQSTGALAPLRAWLDELGGRDWVARLPGLIALGLCAGAVAIAAPRGTRSLAAAAAVTTPALALAARHIGADLLGPAAAALLVASGLAVGRSNTGRGAAIAAVGAAMAIALGAVAVAPFLALIPAAAALALPHPGLSRPRLRLLIATAAAAVAVAVELPAVADLGPPDGIDASTVFALLTDHLAPWSALLPGAIAVAATSGDDPAERTVLVWLCTALLLAAVTRERSALGPAFAAAPTAILCASLLRRGQRLSPAAAVLALGVAAIALRDWLRQPEILLHPYLGSLDIGSASPVLAVTLIAAAALFPHPLIQRYRTPLAVGAATLFGLALSAHSIPAALRSHGDRAAVEFAAARGMPLAVLGSASSARRYDPDIHMLRSRHELRAFLAQPTPRAAITPADQLCHLRAVPRLHVVGPTYGRRRVVSNQLLPGERDRNPLLKIFPAQEPPYRLPVGATLRGGLELVGASYPPEVAPGGRFELVLVFRVRSPQSGGWRIFAHFEGRSRFLGDHRPEEGGCPMHTWRPGDIVVDRFPVRAGTLTTAPGRYQVFAGLFRGSRGNWENMPVTAGPRDDSDRVPIGEIELR